MEELGIPIPRLKPDCTTPFPPYNLLHFLNCISLILKGLCFLISASSFSKFLVPFNFSSILHSSRPILLERITETRHCLYFLNTINIPSSPTMVHHFITLVILSTGLFKPKDIFWFPLKNNCNNVHLNNNGCMVRTVSWNMLNFNRKILFYEVHRCHCSV